MYLVYVLVVPSRILEIQVAKRDKLEDIMPKIARAAGLEEGQQFDVYCMPACDGGWVYGVRDNLAALARGVHQQVDLYLNDASLMPPTQRVWSRAHGRWAYMVQFIAVPHDRPAQATPQADAPDDTYVGVDENGHAIDEPVLRSKPVLALGCILVGLVVAVVIAMWFQLATGKIILYGAITTAAVMTVIIGLGALWAHNPVLAGYLAVAQCVFAMLPLATAVIFAKDKDDYGTIIDRLATVFPQLFKAVVDAAREWKIIP